MTTLTLARVKLYLEGELKPFFEGGFMEVPRVGEGIFLKCKGENCATQYRVKEVHHHMDFNKEFSQSHYVELILRICK